MIEATLDADGQLHLSRQSQLPPGPVRVIIQSTPPTQRGLADVIREIAAERGSFPGRSAEDLHAQEQIQLADDAERDRELDTARGSSP